MSSSPDSQASAAAPGSKLGLPSWLAALILAFTTGVGATATFYEKVRVPSLQEATLLRDKQLEVTQRDLARAETESSKLRAAHDQCMTANASWVSGSGQCQTAAQQMQACTAEVQANRAVMQEVQRNCSLTKQLEVLRADKRVVDVALSVNGQKAKKAHGRTLSDVVEAFGSPIIVMDTPSTAAFASEAGIAAFAGQDASFTAQGDVHQTAAQGRCLYADDGLRPHQRGPRYSPGP
jgi:hypothetical protein